MGLKKPANNISLTLTLQDEGAGGYPDISVTIGSAAKTTDSNGQASFTITNKGVVS